MPLFQLNRERELEATKDRQKRDRIQRAEASMATNLGGFNVGNDDDDNNMQLGGPP